MGRRTYLGSYFEDTVSHERESMVAGRAFDCGTEAGGCLLHLDGSRQRGVPALGWLFPFSFSLVCELSTLGWIFLPFQWSSLWRQRYQDVCFPVAICFCLSKQVDNIKCKNCWRFTDKNPCDATYLWWHSDQESIQSYQFLKKMWKRIR